MPSINTPHDIAILLRAAIDTEAAYGGYSTEWPDSEYNPDNFPTLLHDDPLMEVRLIPWK